MHVNGQLHVPVALPQGNKSEMLAGYEACLEAVARRKILASNQQPRARARVCGCGWVGGCGGERYELKGYTHINTHTVRASL
jgi:hypothetical protein